MEQATPHLEQKIAAWHDVELRLQIADIILIHGEGTLFHAIQHKSHSYWNHVALVLQPPNPKIGLHGAFIIGAIDEGIEVHRLRKYSEHLDRFDIGVKRFPGLTMEMRERIVSFLLNAIDAPYDYTRLFGYLFEDLLKYLLPLPLFKQVRHAIIHGRPNAYVCSTFIQHAFYDNVAKSMRAATLARNIHDPGELEEITPGDFAQSPHYEWLYNPHL